MKTLTGTIFNVIKDTAGVKITPVPEFAVYRLSFAEYAPTSKKFGRQSMSEATAVTVSIECAWLQTRLRM